MKYVSVKKNNIALSLCFTTSLIAAVFLGLSLSGLFIKSIWQLGFLVFTVTAIQIAQRYLMVSYEYILDSYEDIGSFNRLTVIRSTSRNRSSVYTVPLSSLTTVIPYKKMRKVEREYGRIGKKFNFCSDIKPKESYLLVFEQEDSLTLIRLQCDMAFKDEIEGRMGL